MRVITSLVKGLDILEYIGNNNNGAKVSDIAKAFDTPTSNITLFLKSLVQKRYIIKCEITGKYYISDKISRLAEQISHGSYSQLSNIADKEMKELQKVINEDTLIGVLNGYKLQFIHRVRAANNIQIKITYDTTYAPHVTAGGKAILAYLPEKKLKEYFKNTDMEQYTDKTITDKAALEAELTKVREDGYAINRGEWESEIMAVAAPIYMEGIVRASLVLQFPTYRHSEKELTQNAQKVIDTANKISLKLEEQSPIAEKFAT